MYRMGPIDWAGKKKIWALLCYNFVNIGKVFPSACRFLHLCVCGSICVRVNMCASVYISHLRSSPGELICVYLFGVLSFLPTKAPNHIALRFYTYLLVSRVLGLLTCPISFIHSFSKCVICFVVAYAIGPNSMCPQRL